MPSFLQLRLKGERIFDMGELWHLHLRSELGISRIAAAVRSAGLATFLRRR